MAEVNVQKKQPDGQGQHESQSLQRGHDRGLSAQRDLPSFWSDPAGFFNMSPFALMRRFTEDMDRVFSGAGSGLGRGGMWSPSIDISERDGKMIVHADLPGLSKDDVKVEMTEDSLTIQGERKREHEEQGKGFHRSERSYGSFYRCVPLPRGAQTESAQARFENGVLEISVPVPDESQKRRQIPVEAGNAERKNAASEGGAQKRESKAG